MNFKEKDYYLRTSDYDKRDLIRPSAIMDMFQDAAGQNAEEQGVGYKELFDKDIIWVLLRNRFDVIKYPPLYATVRVKTWPHPRGKADFDRDYLVSSVDGKEVYIKGSSKWCLCNIKTRRIIFAKDVVFNDETFLPDVVYQGGLNKIKDFSEEGFEVYEDKTHFCDLDHNGHINNIKYTDYILNAVSPKDGEAITYLEIDYIKEMPSDRNYKIFYKKTGAEYLMKCVSGEVEVFMARMGVSK